MSVINVARSAYVEKCRNENEAELNQKYLLKYERNNKGERVGVVLAYKDAEGVVKIGWSRCHTKLEPFNKYIGVNKAIKRAVPLDSVTFMFERANAPRQAAIMLEDMEVRATNYFRVGGDRPARKDEDSGESVFDAIRRASGSVA